MTLGLITGVPGGNPPPSSKSLAFISHAPNSCERQLSVGDNALDTYQGRPHNNINVNTCKMFRGYDIQTFTYRELFPFKRKHLKITLPHPCIAKSSLHEDVDGGLYISAQEGGQGNMIFEFPN